MLCIYERILRMPLDDDSLAGMLRSALTKSLDPQVGETQRRFDRIHGDAPAFGIRSTGASSHRKVFPFWMAGVGSLAAGVAIAFGIFAMNRDGSGPAKPVAPSNGSLASGLPIGPKNSVNQTVANDSVTSSSAVRWTATLDDGIVPDESGVPRRRMRNVTFERTFWRDADGTMHQRVMPVDEEVFYLSLQPK